MTDADLLARALEMVGVEQYPEISEFPVERALLILYHMV